MTHSAGYILRDGRVFYEGQWMTYEDALWDARRAYHAAFNSRHQARKQHMEEARYEARVFTMFVKNEHGETL